MEDRAILKERAQNLWGSFARKVEAIGPSTTIEPIPDFDLAEIGGLDGPKDEIQTYACAATSPEVYAHWGTYPPSGLLLIGKQGVGKTLLVRALANLTETSFLRVDVPRLVVEVIHRSDKVGELLAVLGQRRTGRDDDGRVAGEATAQNIDWRRGHVSPEIHGDVTAGDA